MSRLFKIALAASLLANLILAGLSLHVFNTYWEDAKTLFRGETERQRLLVENTDFPQHDIIFAGDSLIGDGYWNAYFPDADILNIGIPGSTIDNLFYRWHRVTQIGPRKVFVMCGINNFNYEDLLRDTGHIIEMYGMLLDRIERELPDAEIVIHAVLPTHEKWFRAVSVDDLASVNTYLRREADARGFVFIDLTDVMATGSGRLDPAVSDDGLHLNAEGYQLWAERIRPYVTR